jgi:intein/homing endonuclease
LVLSWNEEAQKFENKKVVQLFRKIVDKYVEIKLSNGLLVKATGEHPFLVNDNWVLAKDLKAKDKLTTQSGSLVVEKIEFMVNIKKIYLELRKDK